jgi:cold shock CspA family protein
MTTIDTHCETQAKHIGRCKWYDKKKGFGIITVNDKSIFAHHTAIRVSSSQYRYLVDGEYVEFCMTYTNNPSNSNHNCQATNITGINGGKLMCETRNEFYKAKASSNDIKKETKENVRHYSPLPNTDTVIEDKKITRVKRPTSSKNN